MKPKIVKRLIPYSPYDMKGFEGWLEEMAAQGLIFERFNYFHDKAVFIQGEPKRIRYRLDPKGRLYNEPARKEAYEQAGWVFEDSLGPWFYLFSCGDPCVPDLHTDPGILAYALYQTIQRYWWWNAPFMVMFLFPVLLLCIEPELRTDLVLWRNQAWSFVLLFLCALLGALCFSFGLRKLCRLRKTLAQGLIPKPGRRQIMVPTLLVLVISWGCRTSFDAYLLSHSRHETAENLPLEQLELVGNWPTLAELEATAEQQPGKTSQWTASGHINDSLLAPVQEYTWQSNTKRLQGAIYQSQLSTDYVQTRSPLFSGCVFDGLLKQEELELSLWTTYHNASYAVTEYEGFSQTDHPKLDRLMAARFRRAGQDSFCFVAQRGNEVLKVDYTGSGSYEECLKRFLDTWFSEG